MDQLQTLDATKERKIQFFLLRHQNHSIVKQSVECVVQSHTTLLDLLREHLHFTGVKEACGVGECGACTVIMNGQAVRACLILAFEIAGAEIMTVEGLSDGKHLHPIQQSFIQEDAVQCGYCIPGFLMAAYELYSRDPHPDPQAIWEAMSGHLCRCTGYQSIFHAIENAQNQAKPSNFSQKDME